MANVGIMENLLDSLVSISRFNKGEANRIFDEVRVSGVKVVLKNNSPTCVLLSPEVYKEMIDTIKDYQLYLQAEARTKVAKTGDYVCAEVALRELGISKAELEAVEVEIE